MDAIKNAVKGAKGGAAENKDPNAQGQKEDYVDKARTAFSMGVKKSGHNIDRNTQEKITDSGRGAYESVTGKQVNPKISN
ncbi:hypothetical protein AAL_05245 [Moelleriella libera RCEF 2490]|uniref:Uncharacterized protein n=1 Tax=Moelleriella libera RCEF 2490 TaxID=1081109 RepID=A0A168AS90_9HYPO|nr:hypothetical protein AAL_05245 [Moelleriella libera RCEF 2490]